MPNKFNIAASSKLPHVGTTIFTVMSRLATEHQAINLSQGFPDFQAEPQLFEATFAAMNAGKNQYPPMAGMPELRQAISDKLKHCYGVSYDPEHEITVTAGATQAIFTAVAAFVRPGDEVIIFSPAYDSYAPSIEVVGGRVVYAKLHFPDYRPDWDEVKKLINPRTRMIIINSPHNPTGSILTGDDLDTLAALLENTPIVLLSDEVYEHIIFDEVPHASVAAHPALAPRSITVSSFGKTFHITGWKIGYVVAPAILMQEFRKTHQFNVFTVNTPCQIGLSHYMQKPERYLGLADFYQKKRDFFRQLMLGSGFELLASRGTYFQLARYDAISKQNDRDFATWLTTEIGVAVIPVSAFYPDAHDDKVVRFCFAKEEATLTAARTRLNALQ